MLYISLILQWGDLILAESLTSPIIKRDEPLSSSNFKGKAHGRKYIYFFGKLSNHTHAQVPHRRAFVELHSFSQARHGNPIEHFCLFLSMTSLSLGIFSLLFKNRLKKWNCWHISGCFAIILFLKVGKGLKTKKEGRTCLPLTHLSICIWVPPLYLTRFILKTNCSYGYPFFVNHYDSPSVKLLIPLKVSFFKRIFLKQVKEKTPL